MVALVQSRRVGRHQSKLGIGINLKIEINTVVSSGKPSWSQRTVQQSHSVCRCLGSVPAVEMDGGEIAPHGQR